MRLGCLAAALSVVLVACSGDAAQPAASDLSLELVGRYGSLDGHLALRQIRHISGDPDGQHIYVIQNGVSSVLVLTTGGDSVRTLGRPGDGPGEFGTPGPAHVRGDTTWVANSDGPVWAFARNGTLLSSIRPFREPLPGELRPPMFQGFFTDGSVLLEGGISMNQAADGRQSDVQLAKADRSGVVIDVLGRRSLEGGFFIAAPEGQGVVIGLHPAASWDLWCLDPEGRWLVLASQTLQGQERPQLELNWIGAAGDTIRTETVGFEGLSSERARAAWIDEFAGWSGTPAGQVERLSEAALAWPEYLPARQLVCDQDGRTWIQTPHEHADSAKWMLLGDQGESLGAVVLGRHVRINAALGEDVWGWAPGNFDEPYILKFRLSGL